MIKPAEFPKMRTVKLPNGRIVPLVYPATDPIRGGRHVVFNNKDEEEQYDNTGIALTSPEQTPVEVPYPHGVPWWYKQDSQK